MKITKTVPLSLDKATRKLIEDIINVLSEHYPDLLAVILYGSVARHEERPLSDSHPSDVDLFVVFESDDPLIAIRRGDALAHTVGMAYNRHLDAPHEVSVQFSSRTLREWDPTFIAGIQRDGIVLFARRSLPAPLAA